MTGLDLPDLRVSETPEGPISHRSWDGPAGSTFVLVHGLGGSHLNWIQVAPSLAGLGRVLAPDLPGFGTTPLQGRSSGLMDLRRALAAFITTEVNGWLSRSEDVGDRRRDRGGSGHACHQDGLNSPASVRPHAR